MLELREDCGWMELIWHQVSIRNQVAFPTGQIRFCLHLRWIIADAH